MHAYSKFSKKCNDRINNSALVTEHDIAVMAVNSSHVKFLHSEYDIVTLTKTFIT